jgi:hypothetical protein
MKETEEGKRKATAIGAFLGAIVGWLVFMVVYRSLIHPEYFDTGFMLIFGLIGVVAGFALGLGFTLVFARRYRTSISVLAGITITTLIVPVCSFCLMTFVMVS